MINRVFRTIETLPYRFMKFIVGVIIILAVVYLVMAVIGNIRNPSELKMPDFDEAEYSILIKNTGGILLTNDYIDKDGVVTLTGYWERVKNKFKYKDRTVVLDEKIFGEIEVRKRVMR